VSRGTNLRRVASEFLLIVLGVVSALGVDRWVQGIDDAEAERDYLARLAADVTANAALFDVMLRDWELSRRETAALLALLEEGGKRPSEFGLSIALARAGNVNTAPPREASFRDLESTGNLRLISDPDLRSTLVRYFAQDLQAGRPFMESRLDHRLRMFARDYVPAEVIVGFPELCSAEMPAIDCGVADTATTTGLWSALHDDPSVVRMLNSRHADILTGLRMIRRWAERTAEVQVLLSERLGPRP